VTAPGSHRRVHAATTFLIRSFAPGDLTHLRSWSAKLEKRGERVTILFDLPSDEARARAEKLLRQAASFRNVAVGGKAVRELSAEIFEDQAVLSITALLVKA
jgi:hypothetical protein